jgi:hypothetical protein
MPVVDGTLVANFPLAVAEQHVDFPAVHNLILTGRVKTEKAIQPLAKRFAASVALIGYGNTQIAYQLADRISHQLEVVANTGARHARQEITSLRAAKKARAALTMPPPDTKKYLGKLGPEELRRQLRRRAWLAAVAIEDAVNKAAKQPGLSQDERLAALTLAAQRAAHNVTLELVGDAVNGGRTLGATTMANPPEFAMRSEQLDKETCDPCTEAHGTIVQVDSNEYFATLPPAYCLGGGRCRGVMVFGDGPVDVRQPDLLAA